MKRYFLALVAALALPLSVRAQFDDDAMTQGAGKPRYALLIGVDEYRSAGETQTLDGYTRLRNLMNPCRDVNLVSKQLQQLGWRGPLEDEPEIDIRCNPSAGWIRERLRGLLSEVKKDAFILIYFAGHAVEINGSNYVFGANAKFKPEDEAERLIKGDNVLFKYQAVDLSDWVSNGVGVGNEGNILLVIDACRDDPLAYRYFHREKIPVSAPIFQSRAPGVVVMYATGPGQRISDGVESSLLAEYLTQAMKPGIPVYSVLGRASIDVYDATYRTLFHQFPTASGGFRTDPLCFSGCAVEEQRCLSPADADSPATDSALLWDWAGVSTVNAQAPVTPTPTTDTNTLFVNTEIAGGQTLDVFWCEGPQAAYNRPRAEAAAAVLAAPSFRGIAEARSQPVRQVRVRPFSQKTNAIPGYRISGEAIRVYRNAKDELALAEVIRQQIQDPLVIQRVRTPTVNYLSLFYCGSEPSTASYPALYIHVPEHMRRGEGVQVADTLRASLNELYVADEIEVRASSPNKTQVRFYEPQSQPMAQSVQKLLLGLGYQAEIQDFAHLRNDAQPKLVEVWIGKADKLDR